MVDSKSIGSKRDHPKTVNGETSSSTSSMCDVKRLVSKADSYAEIVMDSSGTEVIDVKKVSKGGKYTEKANHETGSSGRTSLYAKITSKGEDHMNIANDLLHSGSAVSIDVNGEASRKRRRKKKKKKKLATSIILNPEIADSGRQDDSISEQSHDLLHSGSAGSINVNGEALRKRRKKRKKRKKKKLAVSVILNFETASSGRQDASISKQSHVFGEQMEKNIASSFSETLIIGNGNSFKDQNLVTSTLKDFAKHQRMKHVRTHVATSRKMLLILDVNGLLADIVHPSPKDFKSDIKISKRAIFKRPFLDDFLIFCFERFDVAIWSSRMRKILDPVVDYLLGDLKKKLVFLWDISHCTNSKARSLENHHKFIVFKKLTKIWEENGHITSQNGFYDESNTLLVDDSPYKALLNPRYTGIFPYPYSYKDINDNSLGPDGDLRVYLEGVAATENVKMYLEQHPFGQHAIDETSPYWGFYTEVLKDVS